MKKEKNKNSAGNKDFRSLAFGNVGAHTCHAIANIVLSRAEGDDSVGDSSCVEFRRNGCHCRDDFILIAWKDRKRYKWCPDIQRCSRMPCWSGRLIEPVDGASWRYYLWSALSPRAGLVVGGTLVQREELLSTGEAERVQIRHRRLGEKRNETDSTDDCFDTDDVCRDCLISQTRKEKKAHHSDASTEDERFLFEQPKNWKTR